MDLLNRFMADNCFPEELKMRLRHFFRNKKDIAKNTNYQSIVNLLSPKLQVSPGVKGVQAGVYRTATKHCMVPYCVVFLRNSAMFPRKLQIG